jgi:arylsulfatase A-like enzyme
MNHSTTKILFAVFVALLAILFPSNLRAQRPTQKPNIVVILTDDQGWADIGYNNPKVYTPNMDKLAKSGATLVNHYVMPQCTPTRVALMTGRYPSRFGGAALAASNAPAFPLGTPTVASMLKRNGYNTCLTGKWHLGSNPDHGPNHFGFDHSYGSFAGAVGMYDHRYRKGKFNETWHRNHEIIEGYENGTHATDLVANEAINFINTKRDAPFFLYVPFQSIHTPLDERGQFVDRPTQLDPANPNRWLNEDEIKWFNDPKGIIQRETDPEKRLLLAAAYHMDDAIGKIVAALEKSGQRENTLLLFSSDNGPQVNWGGNAYPDDLKLTDFNQPLPMRGKKVDVWEGGIHVPGFANWPGHIKPTEINDATHIVDWYPTLAAMVDDNAEQHIAFDGVDLSSLLFENKSLVKRDLYWNWNTQTNRWALRYGDWKIVKYGVGAPDRAEQWQLFNLQSDPKEKNNVASQNREVLQQLHSRFLQHRAKDKVTLVE